MPARTSVRICQEITYVIPPNRRVDPNRFCPSCCAGRLPRLGKVNGLRQKTDRRSVARQRMISRRRSFIITVYWLVVRREGTRVWRLRALIHSMCSAYRGTRRWPRYGSDTVSLRWRIIPIGTATTPSCRRGSSRPFCPRMRGFSSLAPRRSAIRPTARAVPAAWPGRWCLGWTGSWSAGTACFARGALRFCPRRRGWCFDARSRSGALWARWSVWCFISRPARSGTVWRRLPGRWRGWASWRRWGFGSRSSRRGNCARPRTLARRVLPSGEYADGSGDPGIPSVT